MPNNPSSLVQRVFPTSYRLLVEKIIKNSDFSKYRRILVVGAGHDPYRSYFMNADHYVAMDIELIKGKTSIVADAHKLPFLEQYFDCVLAIEVLEHLESPDAFFSELYRVMSKDGYCLLTVPFMFHIHGDPFDYCRFTPYKINMMLNRFTDVKIYPQGNRLQVISDLFTTSKIFGYKIFVLFRLLNLLIYKWSEFPSKSSSPSGFVVNIHK